MQCDLVNLLKVYTCDTIPVLPCWLH